MTRHRPVAVALCTALLAGVATVGAPAQAQEPPATPDTTSTTAPLVPVPPIEETTTTTTDASTTTTVPPPLDPADPGAGEELPTEEVPTIPDTVPERPADPGVYGQQAGRLLRQQLRVAEAEAVGLESSYTTAKDLVVRLEGELDLLEVAITTLSADDRAAVRRVEAARRLFEARAANAVVRGRIDDAASLVFTDDPNELAVAQTLIGSVLEADQTAVRDYLAVRDSVDAQLVGTAERLVAARQELAGAREALVEARRARVAAQFNLAVFAAGSEIVIHGFVFPVGEPHSFGDSFGAPRMLGSTYEHAHQGTDIMAPFGTPLYAAERGLITRMGTDVLGGIKIWVKGESGTYYYYAHLMSFAEGMAEGKLVEAGDVIGFVGDTGNARGGAPHLHFEIHPDGGAAVNPYPLLKVVDDLNQSSRAARG